MKLDAFTILQINNAKLKTSFPYGISSFEKVEKYKKTLTS